MKIDIDVRYEESVVIQALFLCTKNNCDYLKILSEIPLALADGMNGEVVRSFIGT